MLKPEVETLKNPLDVFLLVTLAAMILCWLPKISVH